MDIYVSDGVTLDINIDMSQCHEMRGRKTNSRRGHWVIQMCPNVMSKYFSLMTNFYEFTTQTLIHRMRIPCSDENCCV